jgi:hypothetical protein
MRSFFSLTISINSWRLRCSATPWLSVAAIPTCSWAAMQGRVRIIVIKIVETMKNNRNTLPFKMILLFLDTAWILFRLPGHRFAKHICNPPICHEFHGVKRQFEIYQIWASVYKGNQNSNQHPNFPANPNY